MSQKKYDLIWSCKTAGYLEQKIGEKVAEILHREHAGEGCPIRNISLKIGISSNTVRKWYGGKNPPYLAHFMILAKYYPAILQMFLEGTGHDYVIPHIRPQEVEPETAAQTQKKWPEAGENVLINVLINPWPEGLNERQVWFLTELSRKVGVAAEDIVQHRNVTDKTARRDIADLKMRKLIRLEGARRTGKYVILKHSGSKNQ
ncbi:MAG: DeoR family transcriptional regulator [Proteobacteria bacterium]|nr:DeoR family transcriptional regulator [Pseudomonadota bacterium]